MNISPDVLRALANERVADFLITGEAEAIIAALLKSEVGSHIGCIGGVVAVKLTLKELATLVDQDIQIDYIQLNRNVKDQKIA